MLTLEQFRATGRDVADLETIDDIGGAGVSGPGRVYVHNLYIEGSPSLGWCCTISNDSRMGSLAEMETFLYTDCYSSEYEGDVVRDFLTLPVTDLKSGQQYIRTLVANQCEFHFDDNPDEVIVVNHGGRALFTTAEAAIVRARVAALRKLDWSSLGLTWKDATANRETVDCPIAYLLYLEGQP